MTGEGEVAGTRQWLAHPSTGSVMRPGVDCPNCGTALPKGESGAAKVCSAGCGFRQKARR